MVSENIKAISDFLFIENDFDEIKKANLVVVLCNNNISGLAELIDKLFKSQKIDNSTKIILSGASGKLDEGLEKEAIRLSDMLDFEYGYNKNLFTLECEAKNIYENLLFSKDFISSFDQFENIILIGAAFALRRIKLCASRLDYPVDRLQFLGTVDDRRISKDEWWETTESKTRVYEELERIGKYLVKGDLDIR